MFLLDIMSIYGHKIIEVYRCSHVCYIVCGPIIRYILLLLFYPLTAVILSLFFQCNNHIHPRNWILKLLNNTTCILCVRTIK